MMAACRVSKFQTLQYWIEFLTVFYVIKYFKVLKCINCRYFFSTVTMFCCILYGHLVFSFQFLVFLVLVFLLVSCFFSFCFFQTCFLFFNIFFKYLLKLPTISIPSKSTCLCYDFPLQFFQTLALKCKKYGKNIMEKTSNLYKS